MRDLVARDGVDGPIQEAEEVARTKGQEHASDEVQGRARCCRSHALGVRAAVEQVYGA